VTINFKEEILLPINFSARYASRLLEKGGKKKKRETPGRTHFPSLKHLTPTKAALAVVKKGRERDTRGCWSSSNLYSKSTVFGVAGGKKKEEENAKNRVIGPEGIASFRSFSITWVQLASDRKGGKGKKNKATLIIYLTFVATRIRVLRW